MSGPKKGVLRGLKRCTRPSELYDSAWERDYMALLEGDTTIKRWERCRSLRIPYSKADGKRGYYNPDFIVERIDGTKELHEVKGGHLLTNEETKRKLAAAGIFCRKRGMIFKVITRR
ncbi:MAG: TnsA endonuclease N-terminal domain-containing protein [Candidatus Binatia bacterium]